MSTSIFRRLTLAALGLACAQAGHAVHIDPDGRGQALIYPYYTVNAGKATLLSVINTSASAKAVSVRFHESRNGAGVMNFNLYLAPFDVWTGAVTAPPAGNDYAQAAPARITSSDNSCTAPQLPASGQDFYNYDYADQFRPDPGPHEVSRTREGFIEVIELGRVENVDGFAAADAIQRSAGGDSSGCELLSQAWRPQAGPSPQSLWHNQPGLGVLSPDGGLQGSAIIVDVALGSSFSVPTVALGGFFVPAADCAPDCRGRRDENLHTPPGNSYPSLADARSGEDDRAVAEFHHGGRAQQMSFTGAYAGLKAVSAVLMRQHLENTFQQSAADSQSLVTRTEWVVTFPTKHLHLARHTPAERLPFRSAYVWDAQAPTWPYQGASGACERLHVDYGDREGQRLQVWSPAAYFNMPVPPSPGLCHASQVLALNDMDSVPANTRNFERGHEVLRGDRASPLLGSAHPLRWRTCRERFKIVQPAEQQFNDCKLDASSDFTEGWMRLEFGDPQRNYLYSTLQPDASQPGSTNLLLGLPAVGFAVTEFEGSGTPGVLANFSILQTHSGERALRAGQLDAANPAGGWTPVSGD